MATFIDHTGQRFGRLTVVGQAPSHINPSGRSRVQWNCQCDCGGTVVAYGETLRRGDTQSCGCLRIERTIERRLRDLTGRRFGRLTVIDKAPSRVGTGRLHARWNCRCDCGDLCVIDATSLLSGHTRSCCRLDGGGGGYTTSKPGLIYLIISQEWQAVKVGISNNGDARLRQHSNKGWAIYKTWVGDGKSVLQAEQAVLKMWKNDGIPDAVPTEAMPQRGETETAPLDLVDLAKTARTITTIMEEALSV